MPKTKSPRGRQDGRDLVIQLLTELSADGDERGNCMFDISDDEGNRIPAKLKRNALLPIFDALYSSGSREAIAGACEILADLIATMGVGNARSYEHMQYAEE